VVHQSNPSARHNDRTDKHNNLSSNYPLKDASGAAAVVEVAEAVEQAELQ